MKCPHCGNRLPHKAKYCDKCGYHLNNTLKYSNVIILICIALALLIAIQTITNSKIFDNDTTDTEKQKIPQLTLEQYDAIEKGMNWSSYIKAASTGMRSGTVRKGRSISDTEQKAVFGWAGKYSGNKCAVLVTFDKNGDDWRISEIREVDFLDGKEIHDNSNKTSRTSLSLAELESILEGTSYEDFAKTAGSKGILISSWSTKGGSTFKQYEWLYEDNGYQYTYDAVFCDGLLNRNLENN